MDIRGIDSAAIRELAHILDETNLTELEIEGEGTRIRVARTLVTSTQAVMVGGEAQVAMPPAVSAGASEGARAAAAPSEETAATSDTVVNSPMVGTVYLAPEPSAPPFIRVGDKVKKGDVCMIISAMKMMNHISAPRDGVVTAIYVKNEDPVEFGAPLFAID